MVAAMRTAVVTGAGSGLGRAIALELAARGYAVWTADLDAAAAAQTAAEIDSNAVVPGMRGQVRSSATGERARAATLDVRDEAACRQLADGVVAETAALDLWVNNAGVFFSGPPWGQGSELRQTMFDVNATGLINGTLAALAPMIAAGHGHVVNVVSLAGIVAAPGEVVYSASKHAAMAFTIGTQFDLRRAGHRGVRVSAVCPDGIWTPMLEDKLDDPDSAPSFSGRLLTAEEVAKQVGKLTERPRPVLIVPRWRGPQLRLFDLFPRLALRLLPLIMWDARRRQRRYKKKIEAGKWPRRRT
jgi:NAD(P)-dependent dehydrogenase (short-subunit alcohol dehydrogenase family)